MIYHITTKTEWMLAKSAGALTPESLQTEGFIHCSTAAQVEQVANFYFKGHKNLILLEIDDEQVKNDLKWEGEGPQKFPHIYTALKIHWVTREAYLVENEQGVFVFPFQRILH